MTSKTDVLREVKKRKNFKTALSLGFFLAYRDLTRTNRWTTLLIIFVMTLTFLNLIVVQGILVGLIEASSNANRDLYTGDLIVSNLLEKSYIEQSNSVVNILRNIPEVEAITTRYVEGGILETGYKTRIRQTDILNSAGGLVAGIDPDTENKVTGLSSKVIEGEYLAADDFDKVVIGKDMLYKYSPIDSPGLQTLKDVGIGSKVRLVINGFTREVTVKGILSSKVGEVDRRIFMTASQVRQLIGRTDYNVDEIAVRLTPGADANKVKQVLVDKGVEKIAKVQTWSEALPKFITDIRDAFALLGNMIGSIGLVVASITIFIVIFVNAVTRRKFIGILKGIGVHAMAIEISYVIQALFYAVIGTIAGTLFIYGFLVPFVAAHPIDFPFSDGILVATYSGTAIRAAILLVSTAIAGYVPAKIIVKQNTLDAILGR